MFHTYNNLFFAFYRTHSTTLRTARALYTLASLRRLHTTLTTTHSDSINMTGGFFTSLLSSLCNMRVSRAAKTYSTTDH